MAIVAVTVAAGAVVGTKDPVAWTAAAVLRNVAASNVTRRPHEASNHSTTTTNTTDAVGAAAIHVAVPCQAWQVCLVRPTRVLVLRAGEAIVAAATRRETIHAAPTTVTAGTTVVVG